MKGWRKWKKGENGFLSSFYIYSPAAIFPLNGSWNVMLIYNYQQKCVPYINKKNFTFPLFLFFFFLSHFPKTNQISFKKILRYFSLTYNGKFKDAIRHLLIWSARGVRPGGQPRRSLTTASLSLICIDFPCLNPF